jgi:hypothetical protein
VGINDHRRIGRGERSSAGQLFYQMYVHVSVIRMRSAIGEAVLEVLPRLAADSSESSQDR